MMKIKNNNVLQVVLLVCEICASKHVFITCTEIGYYEKCIYFLLIETMCNLHTFFKWEFEAFFFDIFVYLHK